VSSGWELPIWETVYAGFHSDIYGHEVEHAAEQYALFMFLVGDICAIVAMDRKDWLPSLLFLLAVRLLNPLHPSFRKGDFVKVGY